jgi:hypothetical protein
MTVWSKRKKNPAMMTTEIIEWMQKHTIGDLKEIASRAERNGEDAASVKRLLMDLEQLEAETLGATEAGSMSIAMDEMHFMPR